MCRIASPLSPPRGRHISSGRLIEGLLAERTVPENARIVDAEGTELKGCVPPIVDEAVEGLFAQPTHAIHTGNAQIRAVRRGSAAQRKSAKSRADMRFALQGLFAEPPRAFCAGKRTNKGGSNGRDFAPIVDDAVQGLCAAPSVSRNARIVAVHGTGVPRS